MRRHIHHVDVTRRHRVWEAGVARELQEPGYECREWEESWSCGRVDVNKRDGASIELAPFGVDLYDADAHDKHTAQQTALWFRRDEERVESGEPDHI